MGLPFFHKIATKLSLKTRARQRDLHHMFRCQREYADYGREGLCRSARGRGNSGFDTLMRGKRHRLGRQKARYVSPLRDEYFMFNRPAQSGGRQEIDWVDYGHRHDVFLRAEIKAPDAGHDLLRQCRRIHI